MNIKKIVIFGGGTLEYVRPHIALCAPAFGTIAVRLATMCEAYFPQMDVIEYLSKMAGGDAFTSGADLKALVNKTVTDLDVKIVFFPAAVCDFVGAVDAPGAPGKYGTRLDSHDVHVMTMFPTPKLVTEFRRMRKDICLIAFKTTAGETEQGQYLRGLRLLKESSANLVFANDTKTRLNMIVTPEEAKYHVTTNREEALVGLVEMVELRSQLTFTRSTIVEGERVAWTSDEVPPNLREVVDFCIRQHAYKPFNGSTVGHFAAKLSDTEFLSSIRKTDFNRLADVGMVRVKTDGPDRVIAYGAKPSVGGQSQRIVFAEHPGMDCIVHFHCPIRPDSSVPIISQREFECGSHECGQNTSNGLREFTASRGSFALGDESEHTFYAVYLDQHGPNIVFSKDVPSSVITKFITTNFDLSEKTGGPVSSTAEKIENTA